MFKQYSQCHTALKCEIGFPIEFFCIVGQRENNIAVITALCNENKQRHLVQMELWCVMCECAGRAGPCPTAVMFTCKERIFFLTFFLFFRKTSQAKCVCVCVRVCVCLLGRQMNHCVSMEATAELAVVSGTSCLHAGRRPVPGAVSPALFPPKMQDSKNNTVENITITHVT